MHSTGSPWRHKRSRKQENSKKRKGNGEKKRGRKAIEETSWGKKGEGKIENIKDGYKGGSGPAKTLNLIQSPALRRALGIRLLCLYGVPVLVERHTSTMHTKNCPAFDHQARASTAGFQSIAWRKSRLPSQKLSNSLKNFEHHKILL